MDKVKDRGARLPTLPGYLATTWLRARLKSAADIQEIEVNRVQSAVVEIKNPAFVLEKLKTEFQKLPRADKDNLQANLTPQIEFILGPPASVAWVKC